MNLEQYRGLLQDLLDDVDRLDKSLLEMRNLQAYAKRKIAEQDNVDRYRDILHDVKQDLNRAEHGADELRSLTQYVQRKLGEGIKLTPHSVSTTSRERPVAPLMSDSQPAPAPSNSPVRTNNLPKESTPSLRLEVPSNEPHSEIAVSQVIDDGSEDTVRPRPQPVVPQVNRSAQTMTGAAPVAPMPPKVPRRRATASNETVQSDGDMPLLSAESLIGPPESKEHRDTDSTRSKG